MPFTYPKQKKTCATDYNIIVVEESVINRNLCMLDKPFNVFTCQMGIRLI